LKTLILFLLFLAAFAECFGEDVKKKITATGDMAYPPLEFINEDGKPDGFNVDVFKAVMEELGMDYEICLLPWAQAIKSVDIGSVDLLIDFGYSEERGKSFEFGKAHNYLSAYIICRKGDNIKTSADLKGKEIILQDAEIMQSKVQNLQIENVKYTIVRDAIEGIKLLMLGKGDVFICNKGIALYYVDRLGGGNLEANEFKSIAPIITCFATRHYSGAELLLDSLDKAEARIRQKGIYAQIYKKWFVYDDHKIHEDFFWSLLALSLFLLMLGFAFITILRIKVQKATLDLRLALKEAKDAAKAKSVFLAIMSHEIRTPLNSVIGFTDLLKTGAVDTKTQTEYVKNISLAANSLLLLINDILDLSKLESGKISMHAEYVEFARLCDELGKILWLKMREKRLEFIMDISPMPKVKIDKQRVRQVLYNLIGNAIKFTYGGSITVSAHFEKNNENIGTLIFSVSDTGVGIAPENHKKIFSPFEQVESERGLHAQNGGTGLGLPICVKILECMGGSISVESDLGKGSVFTVRINGLEHREYAPDCPEGSTADLCGDWAQKKILIVDDIKMNLFVLDSMLKRTGAKVSTTTSPTEALAMFKAEHFDIVLTDMWMPELSGAELAAAMRLIRRDTLIFGVTADVEAMQNFEVGSLNGILVKPITLERLNEAINLSSAHGWATDCYFIS